MVTISVAAAGPPGGSVDRWRSGQGEWGGVRIQYLQADYWIKDDNAEY